MKNEKIGHLLAIITVVIWSSTFIVSKLLLEYLTPLQILFGRFTLAALFLSIIYPKFKRPNKFKEELMFLVLGSSLGLYFYFENTALLYTYSSNVSLIVATIPIITSIIGAIVYRNTKFNTNNIVGFIIAYVGVIIIILSGTEVAGINPLGDLIALLAAFMFAIYSLLLQKVNNTYHTIQLTRKIFMYGAVVLGLLMIASDNNKLYYFNNNQVIYGMFFLGIIASSLAFISWNKAIKTIGSIKANQYIYLVPIFTTVFSYIFIDEKITLFKIIGTGTIILGLYISQKSTIIKKLIEKPSEKSIT